MRTIWKFPFFIARRQIVNLPLGARMLSCQLQQGVPTLWVLVDEGAPIIDQEIWCIGTGHEVPRAEPLEFVATLQDGDGFVWHIFRRVF